MRKRHPGDTKNLCALTFLESFATICVERGAFFFSHEFLGFTDAANLWLSLCFGLAYVCGALSAHRVALAIGEKRALAALLLLQIALHGTLVVTCRRPSALFVCCAALGLVNGVKWPIIESYVGAGKTPEESFCATRRFNLSWSVAVPIALAFCGPALRLWPPFIFANAVLINVAGFVLLQNLPARPVHMHDSHPSRPAGMRLAGMRRLLVASRWLMLLGYSSLWILSALLPSVFSRLGVGIAVAPALACMLDVCRLSAFAVFGHWVGWEGKRAFLGLLSLTLPVGFVAAVSGSTLAVVVAGEIVFGLSIGAIYCAAFYYAMVSKNASVDAGGGHEAMIGSGFTLGPLVGLAAASLLPHLGSRLLATLTGTGPLILFCLGAAWLTLLRPVRGHAGQR